MFDPNQYFKQIAESHKEIQHTELAPAFFREYSSSKVLFDNSEFLSKMRYVKRIGIVSQFNNDSNFFGPHADAHFKSISGAVYVIMKVIDKDFQEVQNKTKEIINDIFCKLENDSEQGLISQEINIKLNDISFHTLGLIADNYYGAVMFINFFQPFCQTYNPDKWL